MLFWHIFIESFTSTLNWRALFFVYFWCKHLLDKQKMFYIKFCYNLWAKLKTRTIHVKFVNYYHNFYHINKPLAVQATIFSSQFLTKRKRKKKKAYKLFLYYLLSGRSHQPHLLQKMMYIGYDLWQHKLISLGHLTMSPW